MNRLRSLTAICMLAAVATPVSAQANSGARTLTMREAVTLALQNSRDLRLARVDYNVAQNEAGLDRAAFLPNLYTGAGYVYTYGFPSVPGAGPPAVFELDYTQALFNPLLKGQQRADEERARSQFVEIKRIRDQVIVQAASTYLELAEVQHLSSVMSNDEASAETILKITRERVAANQELPIDKTRAELTVARIRERLMKLQDRVDQLTAQMRDLTGIPSDQSIQVEAEEPALGTDLQQSQVVNLAVQNDRSIQQAEDERAARQRLLHAARMSYWPTANIVGQYDVLSNINNFDQYYKTPVQRNNFNFGVEITIPLFASKTRATVALAKSQLNEAEVALDNRRHEVRLQAQQTTRESRELQTSREVARLDLKLAQQTLDNIEARLNLGKATLADVEQARLDESDKWKAFLDADLAWQESQLKILQATGELAKVLQ